MNVKAIVIVGLVASIVMAMVQMVGEAIVPGGAGFFGPPIAIGATVVRSLQDSGNPIPFDLVGLIVGLVGHMMNSVVLAAMFSAAVVTFGGRLGALGLVGVGVAWGIAVFAVMWFVVVPVLDPLAGNLDSAWFFVAHLTWGASLGYLWARLARPAATPQLAAAR